MAKKNTSKKLCPSHQFFYEPTLKALDKLGGSGSNEEICKCVLEITQLPAEVVEEMHTFTMSEVEYRLMWSRTYLKNFGAVENSKQGVWALTVKGAQMLKSGKIDAKEITQFTNKKHGKELINKLAEYGIGLNEVKSYEIDEDFFNSLEEE